MNKVIGKRVAILKVVAVLVCLSSLSSVAEAFQRGGRGGGGGGGRGMGGARPSMGGAGMGGARPSMGSRPSMPQSRPAPMQMPSSRPSFGNAGRPNMGGGQMPSNLGSNRPMPQTRPAPGMQQRPNFGTNRPSLDMGASNKLPPGFQGGGGGANLPSGGNLGANRPGNRPNVQLPNMPSTNRPRPLPGDSGLTTRPGGGGNFSGDRPSLGGATKPAPMPGNRPGFGGGDRPNIGDRPNNGNRPNIGDRPGAGNRPPFQDRPTTKPAPPTIGGNRPGRPGGGGQGTFPGGNNRPDRPGGGGQGTFPGVNNRPDWNRPDWNRPDWNRPDGNRPWGNGNNNWGNGNNWGINNNNNNFNNININNNNWNNNYFNRPAWDRPGWNGGGTQWGPGYNWNNSWHDHCVHPHYHGWYNGCWSGYWGSSWYSPVVWGAVGWGLGAWTNSVWNSVAYSNPYYVAPAAVASVPYDYSQPVVVNNYITSDADSAGSNVTATSTAAPQVSAKVEQSFSDFDVGLKSFKDGDYQGALKSFDAALRSNGNDPVLHEVRALALFATGDYTNAAAALNSLLVAAPGMDWTTLSGLYGSTDSYTEQLRKLESYCKANPKNAASAFVLAYHYLVIGSKDSAIRALKVVVENQPKDVVAKRMLEALEPKTDASQPGTTPPAPTPGEEVAKPQPEIDLTGKWKATSGTSIIDVSITSESTFSWVVNDGGKKVADHSGDLATNGDAVVFDTKEQGSLGGSVKAISGDEWILMPPGVTKEESGIRFKRVP